jgi:hypothetical protein
VHVCLCAYVCVHVNIYAPRASVCFHACVRMSVYVLVTCTHMSIRVRVCSLYVCLCASDIHVHECMYAHTHTCIKRLLWEDVCINIYAEHVCVCNACICARVLALVCMFAGMYVYTCIGMHAYTRTTYTYVIHSFFHSLSRF